MGPTPAQRSAAEQLKSEGNVLFSKGKYGPAAERYTEAITLDPTFVTLYVNRGMCYKKMKGRWDQVAHDAQTALSLSRDNLKAHYLLGIAQRELHNLDVAITHLGKALDAAREQGDSIKDEIWRELVMRDPVITPSGVSYERSALIEHLSKVGRFDPISRKALGEADIIQNVGLRNAIQQYLKEHPWAWAECL
eukprot:gene8220-8412_t